MESTTIKSLPLEDFASLGAFAPAAKRATEIALGRAAQSGKVGRIPIAGAAVLQREDGQSEGTELICEGCNGRVPEHDNGIGYPTDHGETAALRNIKDFGSVDWSRAVFATTLSPCVMCTRSLIHLHSLGLKRIVIAESKSFPGRKDLLESLPGMQLVELTNEDGMQMMNAFARRYPWDWAADIGEVPPVAACQTADPTDAFALLQRKNENAAIVSSDGRVISSSADERKVYDGNPVRCATMRAFGLAGSAINIREHTLVIHSEVQPMDVNAFGLSALGACELFRPRAVIFNTGVTTELEKTLTAAGIEVIASYSPDTSRASPEKRARVSP
eukprot:TRINITY_DN22343_c0_g1_i1.p1 TRINITY_DN22343_c0_g1~~TRINITY_DN22343_c0_g1_i1.p1  ORF type:complete len:341 (+),score=30.63 TRINITY_DN22343_c0_g1_i1:31-1023(+)